LEVYWKFVASNPVVERVILVQNHVYACELHGGMYCLDAKSGDELWFAPGITQFIAESKEFIYATNFRREISILDPKGFEIEEKTGRKIVRTLTTIPAVAFDFVLDNFETDRIYVGTASGLFQCLHEIYQSEPIKQRLNRIDLAEQLQAEIAASSEQRPKRQPVEARPATPVSVPIFGSGFEDDETSPFTLGTDEDESDSFF